MKRNDAIMYGDITGALGDTENDFVLQSGNRDTGNRTAIYTCGGKNGPVSATVDEYKKTLTLCIENDDGGQEILDYNYQQKEIIYGHKFMADKNIVVRHNGAEFIKVLNASVFKDAVTTVLNKLDIEIFPENTVDKIQDGYVLPPNTAQHHGFSF